MESTRLPGRDPKRSAERAELLARMPMFRDLSEAARSVIAEHLHSRSVKRGSAIFREGEPPSSLYILASGRVKLTHETEDGQEVIVRLIRPGDPFGGAGIWGEPRYPAHAFAQEDSVVLYLPSATFITIVRSNPDLALGILQLLAGRLREAEARVRELQTEQVEQRIAHVLLRLARKVGVKSPDGIELGTRLTRQDLAELAGTTLSTASRTLSAWHQRGIIVARREHVMLARPHALVDIANKTGPHDTLADITP